MLFSRSRVVIFLMFIFSFMAAIFIYTDELIEDQIERLEADLLRLQAAMVTWVAEEFQDSASAYEAEIQLDQDRFASQQLQIINSLISNAPTSAKTDEAFVAEFSSGAFGQFLDRGAVLYTGGLPKQVIDEALRRLNENPNVDRIETSVRNFASGQVERYVVNFSRNEKLGGTVFTGRRVIEDAAEVHLRAFALEDYLKDLFETRGYSTMILNKDGRIVNAHDPGIIGKTLPQTDKNSGVSLFQMVVDHPDKKFNVLLEQPYEAYALELDQGYMLLMKPSASEEGTSRVNRVLGYGMIFFNLAIVTAVMMFLRKNHAFVIEKISLTEMQVKRRRQAAGFIVVVIVLGFALMILLINGLMSIQMTQLDFDKELQRFSDAMAGQYSEAYESLEDQNRMFNLEMKAGKTERLVALYASLRKVPSELVRLYPSTASSGDYVANWMRVSQTTRELISSQYGVDLDSVEDYTVLEGKAGGAGLTLIGYDAEKLNVWVVQALTGKAAEAQAFSWVPLASSAANIEGFFAHFSLKGADEVPFLEAVLPDSIEARRKAEQLGMELYLGEVQETIGIRKPEGGAWIVYVPASDPLKGDLRRAAYDFTRFMSLATLLLILVVAAGWRHYGRKEPIS